MINILPITGQQIDSEWKTGEGLSIKPKKQNRKKEDAILNASLIKEFPNTLDEIKKYRNHGFCLSHDQFEFSLKPILGQIFSKQIGDYYKSLGKNPDIFIDLDAHLIDYLLSLETMHPQIIIGNEQFRYSIFIKDKISV